MHTYRPSMRFPAGGLAILFLVVIAISALVGALLGLISSWVFVLFLFPVLIGLAARGISTQGIRAGKIRHPPLAIAAAILAGFCAHASFWFVSYQSFPGLANVDLARETGQAGLVGFFLWITSQGLPLTRFGVNFTLLNLGTVLTWIYLLAEVVVILWLAIPPARWQALKPFCESCQRWLGEPQLLGTLGAKRGDEALGYIQNGQFTRLGEELQRNPALPNLGIFLAASGEGCSGGEAYLVVRSQSRRTSGQKVLASGMIPASAEKELLQGIENRKKLYGIS